MKINQYVCFFDCFCFQVNFQHWEKGEPNNKNNVESCAEFTSRRWDKDGSWNDVHCEKENEWVCQISTGNQC